MGHALKHKGSISIFVRRPELDLGRTYFPTKIVGILEFKLILVDTTFNLRGSDELSILLLLISCY